MSPERRDPMRLLLTGHAGVLVRARSGATVLCDPWFNPAYLGSWFPFPDNADLDLGQIASPTYLYISHLHRDHFDARFLAEHVDKSATVLLPDFPIGDLRGALEQLGFHRFVQTKSGRPVDLDGLRVAICTSTSVADGPIGDSAIAIDDGASRILNQNDCHLRDIAPLRALAPYDLHLLQYSGAIWYPMVYRWDAATKAALCREKRLRQGQRAMRYIESVGARHVVPFAGPPAFLDDALFELNDFEDDPTNIFQDQVSFLRTMEESGFHHGHLAVAGSEIVVTSGAPQIAHSCSEGELQKVYSNKREYLEAYRERRRAEIEAAVPTEVTLGETEVIGRLERVIVPLLADAPSVREALGGAIVLDVGTYGVVIDPAEPAVRRWNGEEPEHYFGFSEAILSSLVERGITDWVNELFLSCRFEATRTGDYNEAVFSFFKCLTGPRMQYYEASLALVEQETDGAGGARELWQCGPYLVQRYCPHLGADLCRFGQFEGDVLVCTLHGRRYDLRTGDCLTADGRSIFSVTVTAGAGDPAPAAGAADADPVT